MYLDKQRLDGRLALITGGGRGIGLASAEAILESGGRVVISDMNPDVLGEGAAHLKALKGGWIVGGYHSAWLPKTLPAQFKKGFKVVQDILPSSIADSAESRAR